MNKLEIIKDTFLYYNEDPSRRAVEERACVYETKDGRNCAFGRYMLREYLDKQFCNNISINNLLEEFNVDSHDELLVEKVHGHSLLFWEELQDFHDNTFYWDKSGITQSGYDRLMNLTNKYAEN